MSYLFNELCFFILNYNSSTSVNIYSHTEVHQQNTEVSI